MTTITDKTAQSTTFNIQLVQEIVAQSTKNVTQAMLSALILGLQANLNFKGLAEKHINVKLDEELSKSDEKTQMTYKKLFAATQEHINNYSSEVLGKTLSTIQVATGNLDTSNQFLGSFVFVEIPLMINKLSHQIPDSLERKDIWNIEQK
jgi:hypothetical protein